MILELILFFKNQDFSELEEKGYKYWNIENLIIIRDNEYIEIFSNKTGYIKQMNYNVKDPFVRIEYLNTCLYNKFKISINEKSESSKKGPNLLILEMKELGNYDSIEFKMSFYNLNEDCKIRIVRIESNFLKNLDFTEKEYKPKYWQISKNKMWQNFEFKPGTIYKITIKAQGNYKFYIDCLDYKERIIKLKDNSTIVDTIPAYCFKQYFVFVNDSTKFEEIKGEILDTLKFVISSKSKKIFVFKNVAYNGKLLIYDKNGKLLINTIFDENPKIFEFEKRGKYLIVIPNKLRKEVRL
ncbi:MAG: hypothetical protein ABIL37_03215 [candidate division WOR-3 bacterium]